MSLYVVATPIGNLEDLSFRALRILKEVNLIAAEDTRHSRILLKHYGVQTPCTSFHSYSSEAKLTFLVETLKAGKSLALISDAGTPGISDPAFRLIQKALEAQVSVVPVPGAAAFLTALMASGLPIHKFVYLGFLPVKKGRRTLFESLKDEDRTVVFYESPHRIVKTLHQMLEILGEDRIVVLARELTKVHESFVRGALGELTKQVQSHPPKGEIVLLLAPKDFQFRSTRL